MNAKKICKKTISASVGILASFFLFQTLLFAKAMSGHVVAINPDNQSITIEKKVSPDDTMGQQVTVFVKPETQKNGFESLEDLEVGEEVQLEADRKFFFGPWEAESIQAEGQAPQAAAPAQESSVAEAEKPAKENQPVASDFPSADTLTSGQTIPPTPQSSSPTGADLMDAQRQLRQGETRIEIGENGSTTQSVTDEKI